MFSLIFQGAGDAFIGALAFFMAKFKELPFAEIVRRSNEVARLSVLSLGTQTSYPTKGSLPGELFSHKVRERLKST